MRLPTRLTIRWGLSQPLPLATRRHPVSTTPDQLSLVIDIFTPSLRHNLFFMLRALPVPPFSSSTVVVRSSTYRYASKVARQAKLCCTVRTGSKERREAGRQASGHNKSSCMEPLRRAFTLCLGGIQWTVVCICAPANRPLLQVFIPCLSCRQLLSPRFQGPRPGSRTGTRTGIRSAVHNVSLTLPSFALGACHPP
jgi:hypothetical protein